MNNMYLADEAMTHLLENYTFQTVLDIGSGQGLHAKILRDSLKSVVTLDSSDHWGHADIHGSFCDYEPAEPFDAVWCSHVLEHQLNVHDFLVHIYRVLKPGGILVITVPPAKPHIVGGHVSIWNAGLLLYNLILAGFDCSEARIKRYDYNISIILRKSRAVLPKLHMDAGDIERLSGFFPSSIAAVQNFDGDLVEVDWHAGVDARPPAGRQFGAHNLTIEQFRRLPDCHPDDRSNLLWSLACAQLPGRVVEFGVFKGSSLGAMAERQPNRLFHGFDSFTGLPEAWERSADSTYAAGHFATRQLPEFATDNVSLHPGYFDDSLPVWLGNLDEPLALVHVDADLYSSAAFVLEALDPWIVSGTVIVFDELCDWQNSGVYPLWPEGEWRALLEWMERHDRKVRLLSRGPRFSATVIVSQ